MARSLGVSVTWLRAEAEKGALPHVKTDRGMLFDRATVERILGERAKREGISRGESSPLATTAGGNLSAADTTAL
jgi:hypothetical protein